MFASVAQAQEEINVTMKMGAWDLIWNAGPMVKLVMLILFVFSILSWAIILTKRLQLQKVEKDNSLFLEKFWRAASLDTIYAGLDQFRHSPVAYVFEAGYKELQKVAEAQTDKKSKESQFSMSGIENINRALRRAGDMQIAHLEEKTSFLATVGSTSPFIGLFGTVWGIMVSFQGIANTGAASLAVVAPGISEALIATALGLAAAIPAVMGYNYFIGKFRKQDLEINNFTSDFLNIVRRNFFKD